MHKCHRREGNDDTFPRDRMRALERQARVDPNHYIADEVAVWVEDPPSGRQQLAHVNRERKKVKSGKDTPDAQCSESDSGSSSDLDDDFLYSTARAATSISRFPTKRKRSPPAIEHYVPGKR